MMTSMIAKEIEEGLAFRARLLGLRVLMKAVHGLM